MVIGKARRLATALLCGLLLSAGLSVSALAQDAAAAAPGPGEVVRGATDRIMAAVRAAPDYFEDDPERYFREIGAELDRVVDFKGFARGVMGQYASSDRYKSLDAAGKDQLRAQLEQFTATLRDGMIRSYGRGLLGFRIAEMELSPAELSPGSARVASVTQRVTSETGEIYSIKYQMGQYRDGNWRLRNLIIENISLGEIYRGQFSEAAKKENGDLDKVIANWDDNRIQVDRDGDKG